MLKSGAGVRAARSAVERWYSDSLATIDSVRCRRCVGRESI